MSTCVGWAILHHPALGHTESGVLSSRNGASSECSSTMESQSPWETVECGDSGCGFRAGGHASMRSRRPSPPPLCSQALFWGLCWDQGPRLHLEVPLRCDSAQERAAVVSPWGCWGGTGALRAPREGMVHAPAPDTSLSFPPRSSELPEQGQLGGGWGLRGCVWAQGHTYPRSGSGKTTQGRLPTSPGQAPRCPVPSGGWHNPRGLPRRKP